MKFAWWLLKLPFSLAFRLLSPRERKATLEIERVHAFAHDRNVVGLIHMLDSDVRGRSKHRIVRGYAASALGHLGEARAIPYLMEMGDDPEEGVRSDAIRALGQLQAREAEGLLLETLGDPSPDLRMTAASALGQIGAVDGIPLLWQTADSDPDPYVRFYAVEALVILGEESARGRVAEALRAIPEEERKHPRFTTVQEAVDSGAPLTPWVNPLESKLWS